MNRVMKSIKVGLATEEQVNREFIDAWHRAEHGDLKTAEERLYFLEPGVLLRMLSKHRLLLLHTLRRQGITNVKTLSKILHRNYRNVHRDVQLLKKAGLIQQTAAKDIFVPWDKIQAEIDLQRSI